jgi:hypothetical protein
MGLVFLLAAHYRIVWVTVSAIYLPLGLSEKLDKYDSHIVTGPIECLTETSI